MQVEDNGEKPTILRSPRESRAPPLCKPFNLREREEAAWSGYRFGGFHPHKAVNVAPLLLPLPGDFRVSASISSPEEMRFNYSPRHQLGAYEVVQAKGGLSRIQSHLPRQHDASRLNNHHRLSPSF